MNQEVNREQPYQLKEVVIRLKEGGSLYSDQKIESPQDAVRVMEEELSTYDREVVCLVCLNSNGQPYAYNLVSMGSISQSILDMASVMKCCLLTNCASYMIFHNHPSGNPVPSAVDIETTKRLILVGELMGIPCVDHIIIAGNRKEYYSMRENKDVNFSPAYDEVMEGARGMVAEGNAAYADTPFGQINPDEVMASMEGEPAGDVPGGGEKKDEVTLHFGKGLCSFFTSKKGEEMARIKIPNTPFESWPSFVVPARIVHDNRYGKGYWMKLPAGGKTTLTISRKVTGDDGMEKWQDKKMTVENVRLKEMVEAYKKNGPDRDHPAMNGERRPARAMTR